MACILRASRMRSAIVIRQSPAVGRQEDATRDETDQWTIRTKRNANTSRVCLTREYEHTQGGGSIYDRRNTVNA